MKLLRLRLDYTVQVCADVTDQSNAHNGSTDTISSLTVISAADDITTVASSPKGTASTTEVNHIENVRSIMLT